MQEVIARFGKAARNAVQILLAGPSNNGWWRFINGRIEDSRLEFQAYNEPSSAQFDFRWRDANSGQMTVFWPHSTNARFVHSRFQRLDG
jgi:hypothetical protein